MQVISIVEHPLHTEDTDEPPVWSQEISKFENQSDEIVKDLDGLRIEVEAFKAVMDVAQAEVNKEDLEKEINNIRNKISELEKRLENLSSVVGFIHVYALPKIRA